MIADWFILLREHRSCTASTHYVTQAEAERIALVAAQLGAIVVDGPRPQTARESKQQPASGPLSFTLEEVA
jgi:hypothetical protein